MDIKLFKQIATSFDADITEVEFASKYGNVRGYYFTEFMTSDDLVELTEFKIRRDIDYFSYLLIPEITVLNQKFSNAGEEGLPFVFLYVDKGYDDLTLSAWDVLEPIQEEIIFEADPEHGFSLLIYLKDEFEINFISYDPNGEYPDFDIEIIVNFGVVELQRLIDCN